jgi:hypothetical protein
MNAKTAPRKRTWLKLTVWIGIPLGVLLLLCASPFLAFWIWTRGHSSETNRLIAEIEAKGEPITGDQVAAYFPIEPGAEDVTTLWIEALKLLDTPQYNVASRDLPFVGTDSENRPPEPGQPWPQFEACEAFLASNHTSLEKIHEATRRGGYAKFPIDYMQGLANLDLSNTQRARYATRLLRLEFEVKAHRGDIEGAMKSLQSLFLVSRCLQGEGIIVSHLVVSAIDGVAKTALAEKLCVLEMPTSDLEAIQAELRRKDRLRQIREALIGERAIAHSAMRDQSLADPKLPSRPAFDSDIACHLHYMQRYIAATDCPFPEALKEVEKIEGEFEKSLESYEVFTRILSTIYLPATSALFAAAARNIATDRAADAGIAIELYRRERGELPATLDSLVPKYLPNVPVDPFTDSPMIYKVTDEGFAIYSVGKNKTDDGGRFDHNPGEDSRIRDDGLFFPIK